MSGATGRSAEIQTYDQQPVTIPQKLPAPAEVTQLSKTAGVRRQGDLSRTTSAKFEGQFIYLLTVSKNAVTAPSPRKQSGKTENGLPSWASQTKTNFCFINAPQDSQRWNDPAGNEDPLDAQTSATRPMGSFEVPPAVTQWANGGFEEYTLALHGPEMRGGGGGVPLLHRRFSGDAVLFCARYRSALRDPSSTRRRYRV